MTVCKLCTIESVIRTAVILTIEVLAGSESDPTDELYARPVVMPWHLTS